MAKDSMDDFYKKLDGLFAAGDISKVEEYLKEQAAFQTGAGRIPPLNELASFYRNTGRFEESEKYFEEALSALREAGMAGTPQYTTVQINEATLLRVMGRTEDSIRLFREAYDHADRQSYVYVSLINNMALTCLETGDADEAETLLKEAMDWVAAHGAAPHETGVTAVNLTSVYIRKGEWEKASDQVEAAIAAFDKQDKTDCHYASALAARAAIRVHEGRIEEARRDYEQSMQLTERFFGKNHEYHMAKEALKQLS